MRDDRKVLRGTVRDTRRVWEEPVGQLVRKSEATGSNPMCTQAPKTAILIPSRTWAILIPSRGCHVNWGEGIGPKNGSPGGPGARKGPEGPVRAGNGAFPLIRV